MRRIPIVVAAAALLATFAATPAQGAIADCVDATVVVSGDNVVPLGQAQYERTVAVDVTRPAGCTADYRVALPSLSGLSAVNGTTIDLSSARLGNEDAGVAQSGTIRFTDGAVSVTLPLQVTPQRWVKISTADATPEPIDGGESVTVRARSTIVSWNSNAYGSFGNRQHRLQVRNVTAGDSYPGLGSGTIVRSSATGALVKTRTLGSPEAEANTIYGLRFTYAGNQGAGFAPAAGAGDPNGVLVRGTD